MRGATSVSKNQLNAPWPGRRSREKKRPAVAEKTSCSRRVLCLFIQERGEQGGTRGKDLKRNNCSRPSSTK
ncbi:hypothetical protein BDY24DRAFT_385270 [Mrakia frigida]|uniref:uncharacterized protein n=1 Tax=Mrakia frigida TaxID=29902 RepID=UPI003FCC0728